MKIECAACDVAFRWTPTDAFRRAGVIAHFPHCPGCGKELCPRVGVTDALASHLVFAAKVTVPLQAPGPFGS